MKYVPLIYSATMFICEATIIQVSGGIGNQYLKVRLGGTHENVGTMLIATSLAAEIDSGPSGLPTISLTSYDDSPVYLPRHRRTIHLVTDDNLPGGVGFVTESVEEGIAQLFPSQGQTESEIIRLRYYADLEVGPGTPLVRYFNAVDLFWYGDVKRLVLNSSFDWFNSTACNPGSIVSVPISENGEFKVQNSVNYNDRNITESSNYTLHSGGGIYQLTEVTPEVFATISAALVDAGVASGAYSSPLADLLFEYENEFRNCTAVLERLPPIKLAFSPIGEIVLRPKDYTERVGLDRCRLLVSTPHPSWPSAPLKLNFFGFRHRNFRFTLNEMFICDSAITDDITSVH